MSKLNTLYETDRYEYYDLHEANTMNHARAAYYANLLKTSQLHRWSNLCIIFGIFIAIFMTEYAMLIPFVFIGSSVMVIVENKRHRELEHPSMPYSASYTTQNGALIKCRVNRSRDKHNHSLHIETAKVTFRDSYGRRRTASTPYINRYVLEQAEKGFPLIVVGVQGYLLRTAYVVFIEEQFTENDGCYSPLVEDSYTDSKE